MTMEILDKYLEARQQLFDYFGYVEDWVVLPIEDSRGYYWYLTGESYGDEVMFAKQEGNLSEGTMDDGFSHELYTSRHLPKWVYRGAEYTLVVVDACADGNRFLQIFDNAKERPI